MPKTKRKSMPTKKTRRTIMRKSYHRTNLIDEQIREKHAEYRSALEAKARKYGYVDSKRKVIVLDDDYFISKPKGWNEELMGKWIEPVTKLSSTHLSAAENEEMPEPLPLRKSENVGRQMAFRNYYKQVFDVLLNAKKKIDTLESKDVDINNTIATLQALSQTKSGYHQLGKNEVMKSVVDYMGPNSINFDTLISKTVVQRANSM